MTISYPVTKRCPFQPPEELLAARERSPLERVRIWNGSYAWLVTKYAEQRAVLSNPSVISDHNHPGYPFMNKADMGWRGDRTILLNVDGEQHLRMRRRLAPFFSTQALNELKPRIERYATDLADKMLAGPQPADFVSAFADQMPALIMGDLMDLPVEAATQFGRFSEHLVAPELDAPDAQSAMDRMVGLLHEVVPRRLASPGTDMISQMLQSGMAPDEVTLSCTLLLGGGQETSANNFAFGLVTLLQHPDQLAEFLATDDERLISGTVDELIRYASVNHYGRRRVATEDIRIGDVTIRAGESVILPGDLANFDPDVFPDPFRFDIHRESYRHLSFGYGRHACIGKNLAQIDLGIGLRTLFSRIPTLALAVPVEELEFDLASVICRVEKLPVVW